MIPVTVTALLLQHSFWAGSLYQIFGSFCSLCALQLQTVESHCSTTGLFPLSVPFLVIPTISSLKSKISVEVLLSGYPKTVHFTLFKSSPKPSAKWRCPWTCPLKQCSEAQLQLKNNRWLVCTPVPHHLEELGIFTKRTHSLTWKHSVQLTEKQRDWQFEGRRGFPLPKIIVRLSYLSYLTCLMFTKLSVTSYFRELSPQGGQNGTIHLKHNPASAGSHLMEI